MAGNPMSPVSNLGFASSGSIWGNSSTYDPQTGMPYSYGAGMDVGLGDQGFGLAAAPTVSANNPNNVGGTSQPSGYPYGAGMDFGIGSPSFAAPVSAPAPAPQSIWGNSSTYDPQTGMPYSYGTGMNFGLGSPGFGSQPQMSNIDFGYGLPPVGQMSNIDFGYGLPAVPQSVWGNPRTYDPQTGVPYTYSSPAPQPDIGSGILAAGAYPYSGSEEASSALTANTTNTANEALAAFAAANAQAAAETAAWQAASNQQMNNQMFQTAAFGQNQFDQNLSRMQSSYNPFSTQYQSY